MPQTITLTSSVGKSGTNKPGDVRLVQAALKAIKVKTKPLYGGQIDGRSSTALVKAILCFQEREGLPKIGKIEPNKETVRRLARAVPSMAQRPTPQAASTAQQTAAKNQARQSARDIEASLPLPDKERADLCKLVDGAAKEASVALNVTSLDLIATGRIKVTFSPPKIPGVSAPSLKAFEVDIQEKLDKQSMQNASWSKTPGLGLSYEAKVPGLTKGGPLTLEVKAQFDIASISKSRLTEQVILSYWQAMKRNPRGSDTKILKSYFDTLVKHGHIKLRSTLRDHVLVIAARQTDLLLSEELKDQEETSPTGHVFLGGMKPDGSVIAYGFYPKPVSSNLSLSQKAGFYTDALIEGDAFGEGLVKNDTKSLTAYLNGDQRFRGIEYRVSKEEFDKAINHVKNYDQSKDYGLFTNSCVHAAFSGLEQIGIESGYKETFVKRPSEFYEDALILRGRVPKDRQVIVERGKGPK